MAHDMSHWPRKLRHLVHRCRPATSWLSRAAQTRLQARIAQSEQAHGGEIRVCIEGALPWSALRADTSPRERALSCFGELGMWNTDERCGVLVYLLLADQAIELVADRGINQRVPVAQWQALVAQLGQALQRQEREAGLLAVIDALDVLLRQHFPISPGDANPDELPNAPVLR